MKQPALRLGIVLVATLSATLAATLGAILIAARSATAAETTAPANALTTCQTAIGNQPRTAMQDCLKTHLKEAREKMRAAYTRVESQLKKIDSSATPTALRTLKRSQDSFNTFIHRECQRQGAALLGGSGAGDVEQACLVDLTRWRTAMLENN